MDKRLDDKLFEQKAHGHFGFPVAFYQDSYEWCGNRFLYYHWHNELEFEYAQSGDMEFLINNETVMLKEDQALLINRNSLHKACHDTFKDSKFSTIVLNPNVIFGFHGSDIEAKYVSPILESGFNYIIFKKDVSWQKQFIDLMLSTEDIYAAQQPGFEIEIKIRFLQAWQVLYQNLTKINLNLNTPKNIPAIKKAMEFIYINYMNAIALDDIAKSAYISKGECCKLFKRYLKTTPITYLQEYRINQSIGLLLAGTQTITEIANAVGFESSNYYAITFKKIMRMTPTDFKKSRNEKTY